jgi:acetyl-CoA C-acetyltransferase
MKERPIMREVYIVSAARTAIGSFQGGLAGVSAPKLGAVAISAALSRAGITPDRFAQVNEVYMGCVLPAGVGQAPARQATIYSGLPKSVGAVTLNKVCGSGLKAVMMAAQAIKAGDAETMVAGGMENMSQAPFLLPGARDGYRLGNQQVVDSMIKDGLWDVYGQTHMGNCAELCAKEKKISREAQDEFARESYRRAKVAQETGKFKAEIIGVEIPQKKGNPLSFEIDEEPGKGDPAKFAGLRPAFDKEGTVTAANASSINDGGAALVLCSAERVKEWGVTPLARIVGYGGFAQAPEWFTTAPAFAIKNLLEKLKMTPKDIDLYEINEAFSVVSLAVNQELGIDGNNVNVNGGAVALGHPIGASGARILTTLLYALADRKAKYGLASLCIGGGEAVALVVERL